MLRLRSKFSQLTLKNSHRPRGGTCRLVFKWREIMILSSTVPCSESCCCLATESEQDTGRHGQCCLFSSWPLCTFYKSRCNLWWELDTFTHWTDTQKPSHTLQSHQGMNTPMTPFFIILHATMSFHLMAVKHTGLHKSEISVFISYPSLTYIFICYWSGWPFKLFIAQ